MLLNMKDLLAVANERYFAVPAFNIGTGTILKTVLECSEELEAPVILAVHPLEIAFQGDAFLDMCRSAAHAAKVPVCIHMDHGATLEDIYHAIHTGYTSVMIDASHAPFEENVAICRQVVEIAHPLGISVEGELGTIGTTGNSAEGGADTIVYTQPEEAQRFVEETGVDTLAIAIGTAHGLYPKGFVPQLKLELLREIKAAVPVPLVLHGGSGNPDSEIAESVKLGVNKINISSDIKDAFYQQLRQDLAADPDVREPFELYQNSARVMQGVIAQKIKLFGCDGQSRHYHL